MTIILLYLFEAYILFNIMVLKIINFTILYGILTFTGHQEKVYTYEVTVTDGEAIRTVPIKIIVGFPSNENNAVF